MKFLIHGDFGFPWTWPLYLAKLLFMWSFQSGAPNPDGIIRMPARLAYLAVFYVFGNMAFEYFYIASSLVILFVSFMVFSKHFLGIADMRVRLLASAAFTLNPVFLGNFSKLGLILAVAMLPLGLVFIKKAFELGALRYLLFWALVMNVSLVHPYNFAINILVTGGYLLMMLRRYPSFLAPNFKRIIGLGVVVLLLNAYFILPIASMGTVSKDVLTSDGTPTDYTSLIDVSNTGDILTGLSLSKNAFKDYEFYDERYQPVYFAGVFMLYVVTLGVFLLNQKRLSVRHRMIFIISAMAFLALVLLAAVQVFSIGEAIKRVVNLPGGWIFRSPLKWQLYIPFAFAILMVVALTVADKGWQRRTACIATLVSLAAMNGYVGYQVYDRLLTPRTVTTFSALARMDMEHKNVAYIVSPECRDYALDNPRVVSEMTQVFLSKNVQLRQFSTETRPSVNLDNFDYVLTCQDSMEPSLLRGEGFAEPQSFGQGAFKLFANVASDGYAHSTTVFAVADDTDIGVKRDALSAHVSKEARYDFVPSKGVDDAAVNVPLIIDPFENLTFDNLSDGVVMSDVDIPDQYQIGLLNTHQLYQRRDGATLNMSSERMAGLSVRDEGFTPAYSAGGNQRVSYLTPGYAYRNIVPNGSFERGSWQDEVGSCFTQSAYSSVGMRLDEDASEGKRSLSLSAKQQVACVSSQEMEVDPGKKYLLDFVYKSVDGAAAGYDVSFGVGRADDRISQRLKQTKAGDGWVRETREFVVPEGARAARITLYAYGGNNGTEGVSFYDDVKMTAIPDISGKTFLVASASDLDIGPHGELGTEHSSPTSKRITVDDVSSPFYITVKDTFSPHWSMGGGEAVVHMRNVSSLNVWRVDPRAYCESRPRDCIADGGSYDIKLAMDFAPQRWFVVGAVISLLTAVAVILYFAASQFGPRSGRRPWQSRAWRR